MRVDLQARYWFILATLGAVVAVLNAVFGSLVWAAVFGGGALTLVFRGIYAVVGAEKRYVDPGAVSYIVIATGCVGIAIANLAGSLHPAGGSPAVGAGLMLAAAGCLVLAGLYGLGVIRIGGKGRDQSEGTPGIYPLVCASAFA